MDLHAERGKVNAEARMKTCRTNWFILKNQICQNNDYVGQKDSIISPIKYNAVIAILKNIH